MRILWIDNLKFIGIYLVVLGHIDIHQSILNYIYSFHMPLFFFISGYIFNIDKYRGYYDFVKKKTKSLLVPYIIFSIISYIFWILIGKNVGNDVQENINIFTPLFGILYSANTKNYLIHNVSLWFLTCLFIVENIFYFISKLKVKHIAKVLIILSICGFISTIFTFRLPWSIDIALTASVFFGIGYILKQNCIIENLRNKKYTSKYIGITCIIGGFILGYNNGSTGMSSNYYNNIILFYISSIMSILGYTLIVVNKKISKIVTYISRNTIIILGLHLIIFSFIKFIFLVLGIVVTKSICSNITLAIINIYVEIVPIYIINKYTPWIIGNR